jgi:hypothetical protein
MSEKMNSRETPLMQSIQACIDMMPAGPERDQAQGVHDRMCDKIDALPGLVAAQLHMENDRTKIKEVLERECQNVVSELPGGKSAGN